MVKFWHVRKFYVCDLMEQACKDDSFEYHDMAAPNCDDCPVYLEWKDKKKTSSK